MSSRTRRGPTTHRFCGVGGGKHCSQVFPEASHPAAGRVRDRNLPGGTDRKRFQTASRWISFGLFFAVKDLPDCPSILSGGFVVLVSQHRCKVRVRAEAVKL